MCSTASPTRDLWPAWTQAVLLTIPRATNTRADYFTRRHTGRGRNRRSSKSERDQRRQTEVARKRKLFYRRCRIIRIIRLCKAKTRCNRRAEKDKVV